MADIEGGSIENVPRPAIDDTDDLIRYLTNPKWYVKEERRISSAAFSFERFSVDVDRLTTWTDRVATFYPGTGAVSLECIVVRSNNADAILETDENDPSNAAHAHVYYQCGASARKRAAKRIAEDPRIVVLLEPSEI
ncbi:hypothetical protein K2Y11_22440 [bacterium]|nr:hypothetical protein [bacterium]